MAHLYKKRPANHWKRPTRSERRESEQEEEESQPLRRKSGRPRSLNKPVPVSVGRASGMRIDVTASSTPENYPKDLCGEQPCVPLYPISDGSSIVSSEGYKDRFVIVDVGGQTVLIDVAAPADKFDAFLPKAQKVLDTVEWKSE